jgi:hypothetical protein
VNGWQKAHRHLLAAPPCHQFFEAFQSPDRLVPTLFRRQGAEVTLRHRSRFDVAQVLPVGVNLSPLHKATARASLIGTRAIFPSG